MENFDMKPRKYFFMRPDMTKNPAGLILENEDAVKPAGKRTFYPLSVRERGFSAIRGRPQFKYARKEGRIPSDFEFFGPFWIVTSRVKIIFEKLDAAAFEFFACTVIIGEDRLDDEYWLCDVVRIVDVFDEERSDVRIEIQNNMKYYNVAGSESLNFKDESVGDFHIFRLKYQWTGVFCDEFFMKSCKSEKIKNTSFRPTAK